MTSHYSIAQIKMDPSLTSRSAVESRWDDESLFWDDEQLLG
jgi:hypothetical protein